MFEFQIKTSQIYIWIINRKVRVYNKKFDALFVMLSTCSTRVSGAILNLKSKQTNTMLRAFEIFEW